MLSGGGKVTHVRKYNCGYCTNDLSRVFKRVKCEKRHFPAMAVFIKRHNTAFVFDTGYSARIAECGLMSKIYCHLNPVHCREEDSFKAQLLNDGIAPEEIKTIILSHLHPDHIGGLKDFPNSKIVISQKTYEEYRNRELKDLIFTNLLPSDFEKRLETFQEDSYDLFGDQSCVLMELPGHTSGQIGMLLPEYNTLFAADSSWGEDLLEKEMRFAGRCIQKNYGEYMKTIERIKDIRDRGIKVIFSHDSHEAEK